jgi:Fe-S cluster assembly ATP-binding protein
MTSENGTVLRVIDLHLKRDDREILRGVNLFVEQGTVHAILGLNGSGKSTLAYCLMGSANYAADSGEIWLEGEEITHLGITERAQRGLTLAWQEPARFEGLSVGRYISLGMDEPDMDRVKEALDFVGLPPDLYLTRYTDVTLSGGERKRVELAAVYAMRPKLAILDEPDSGVDTMSLDDISGLMHHMADQGTAVVVISHRDEVVQVADVASLICEGKILNTGDPLAVCDRYTRCCQPCDRVDVLELETDYERL